MRLLTLVLYLVWSFLLVEGLEKARYDNYRVYQFVVRNKLQLQLMEAIENYPDGVRTLPFLIISVTQA